MWGVRRSLGVRSLQAKIEERVMQRIGHVLRMENTHPTKRVTLGWCVPPVTSTPERKMGINVHRCQNRKGMMNKHDH